MRKIKPYEFYPSSKPIRIRENEKKELINIFK